MYVSNLLPPINLAWKGWDHTSFSGRGGERTKAKVNGGEAHALAPAGPLSPSPLPPQEEGQGSATLKDCLLSRKLSSSRTSRSS